MNRFYYNECFEGRTDASRIKVENGSCDWLFLAPGYDDTWPSDQAVKRMMQVLQKKQYPHRYACMIYEKGSHLLGMPEEALAAHGRRRYREVAPYAGTLSDDGKEISQRVYGGKRRKLSENAVVPS